MHEQRDTTRCRCEEYNEGRNEQLILCRFNWPWIPPMCRVRGCREERKIHTSIHRCKKCQKADRQIDVRKLPFRGDARSRITNKHRYDKNNAWVDAKGREAPRRSNPSTAAANMLEQLLNGWNTNQSCTIDTGRVINCIAACAVDLRLIFSTRSSVPDELPRKERDHVEGCLAGDARRRETLQRTRRCDGAAAPPPGYAPCCGSAASGCRTMVYVTASPGARLEPTPAACALSIHLFSMLRAS